MNTNKEYFAFISYKSEDVEWATWLQHELEHYHLPTSFNGRTDVPQELRPVFRDIDELSAGNLPEQIRQALANSQNLIVICSPQAAESPWVNQEVETFIALGRTGRIFPFIVEGNSPSEFFPPALRDLPKDEERLGGDVSKKGRDAAFVKVIAGMLGVGFDSLWNRYEKEKAEEERKQREQRDRLLISQSRFLAEKVNSLVEEGDSYTARLLALEALPKDLNNPDRPFVIEAATAFRIAMQYDNIIIPQAHSDRICSVDFNPDGQLIVTSAAQTYIWSSDELIKIWDSKTGKLKTVLRGHDNGVSSVKFSSDGRYVVSASSDKTVKIWDVKSGNLVNTFAGHTKGVNYATFDDTEKYVISVSSDESVIIWNASTGKPIKTLHHQDDNGFVWYASFCSGGGKIITASHSKILIWNAHLWNLCYSIAITDCEFVTTSSDGNYIAAISDKNTILIWDVNSEELICRLKDGEEYVQSVKFVDDCFELLSVTFNGIIRVWDIKREKIVESFVTSIKHISHACFSLQKINNINNYYLASTDNGNIFITDFSEKSLWEMRGLPYLHDTNGRLIACDYGGMDLEIRDLKTEKKHLKGNGKHAITEISFSPSGNYVLGIVSDFKENEYGVLIWNLESKTCIPIITDHTDFITSALFDSEEKRIVTSSLDGTIKIWDALSGIQLLGYKGDESSVEYASFSPDGKNIVSASSEKINIWNAENSSLIRTLYSNTPVKQVKYSPSCNYIASVSGGTTLLWDAKTGNPLYEMKGGKSVSFSPDGDKIIFISKNNHTYYVEIRDIYTNFLLHRLRICEDDKSVLEAKYVTEDTLVVSLDRSIMAWKIPPLQDLIFEAQELLQKRPLTSADRKKYYLE